MEIFPSITKISTSQGSTRAHEVNYSLPTCLKLLCFFLLEVLFLSHLCSLHFNSPCYLLIPLSNVNSFSSSLCIFIRLFNKVWVACTSHFHKKNTVYPPEIKPDFTNCPPEVSEIGLNLRWVHCN